MCICCTAQKQMGPRLSFTSRPLEFFFPDRTERRKAALLRKRIRRGRFRVMSMALCWRSIHPLLAEVHANGRTPPAVVAPDYTKGNFRGTFGIGPAGGIYEVDHSRLHNWDVRHPAIGSDRTSGKRGGRSALPNERLEH